MISKKRRDKAIRDFVRRAIRIAGYADSIAPHSFVVDMRIGMYYDYCASVAQINSAIRSVGCQRYDARRDEATEDIVRGYTGIAGIESGF